MECRTWYVRREWSGLWLAKKPIGHWKELLGVWTVLNPGTEVKFPHCSHRSLHDASLLGVDLSVHGQACVPPLAFCSSQLALSGLDTVCHPGGWGTGADASGGQWSVAVQHLTKAGVVNVEKPRVGTLVACCLREALDVSLEVSGVHGSQVARCNQPSDIYATVDGIVVRLTKQCPLQSREKDSWRHGALWPRPRHGLACASACPRAEPDRGRSTKSSTGQHRHWKSHGLQNES